MLEVGVDSWVGMNEFKVIIFLYVYHNHFKLFSDSKIHSGPQTPHSLRLGTF